MSGAYRFVERPREARQALSTEAVQVTLLDYFATNEDSDPSTVGEAVSELTDGYPFHYDCSRGVTEPLSQLAVEFDYEYVASTETVSQQDAFYDSDTLPSALSAMEWGLLWIVAYDLGLHGCQLMKQTPESRRQLETSDTLIVSLSSRPVDTLDPTVSKFWKSFRAR